MTAERRARLPYVVTPLPGEALDSWIDYYARQLVTTPQDLLTHLGIPSAQPERMVVVLDRQETAALAMRTGVPASKLRAMTLEALDTVAVTIRHPTRGLASPPTWRRHRGSRYCPRCLAESGGRWQLAWRLPWTFACPRHRILLAETCPDCDLRPLPGRPRAVPDGSAGHCTHRLPPSAPGAREQRRCTGDLTSVTPQELPAGGSILTAQTHLDHLLQRVRRDPDQWKTPAAAQLRELFFLGWRALAAVHHNSGEIPDAAAEVLAEAGGRPPHLLTGLSNEDAHDVALATALARLVTRPNRLGSDQVLGWIARVHRTSSATDLGATLAPWHQSCSAPVLARAIGAIDTQMRAIDRLRLGSAGPAPGLPHISPDRIVERAAKIPTTLWPSWSLRLLPNTQDGRHKIKAAEFRTALSALILTARSTDRSYRDALAMIGAEHLRPTYLRNLVTTMHPEHLTAVANALTQLADQLDAHPGAIDYDRRRQLRTRTDLLVDRDAYRELTVRHPMPGTPPSADGLDLHLRALLTGDHTPPPGTGPDARKRQLRYTSKLRLSTHPAIAQFLREQATAHLARLHIAEPVTWEPPAHWVSGVIWPGIDPALVDRTALLREAASRAADGRLAAAAGLGLEHARLYAEINHITTHTPPPPTRRSSPRTTTPPIEILRDLYEHQKLNLSEISRRTGGSRRLITAAIREAGITIHPSGSRHLPPIDPDWLQREYIDRGHSARHLAAQIGVPTHAIQHRAAKLGLHRTLPPISDAFLEATRDLDLPAEIHAAFHGTHAVTRLRALTALLHHPDLRTAARTGGRNAHTLRGQARNLERLTGTTILDTKDQLTPDGAVLLQQAHNIIEQFPKPRRPRPPRPRRTAGEGSQRPDPAGERQRPDADAQRT